uniref:hypothetical protein n=1 Tax=Staphylococcus aureus TaxID=1280 RepID=UPI001594E988|nr:hypothetical protein [Staphylococcus aureus]
MISCEWQKVSLYRQTNPEWLKQSTQTVQFNVEGVIQAIWKVLRGKQREMANGGFEKDRGTLKKLIDKLTCVLIIDEENKKGTKKLLLDPYV